MFLICSLHHLTNSITCFPLRNHLLNNVDDDDHEGIAKVEEEPDLHRLDRSCGGQAGGDRNINRSKDHHTGDIDCGDELTVGRGPHIVGGLFDDIHEDGGQVGDQEYAHNISA